MADIIERDFITVASMEAITTGLQSATQGIIDAGVTELGTLKGDTTAARDAAQAYAQAANVVGTYTTKAALTTGLATQGDGIVLVAADETLGGITTRYTVSGHAITGPGRPWQDASRLLGQGEFGMLAELLQEARTREVIGLSFGTSIDDFDQSAVHILFEQAKKLYGDSRYINYGLSYSDGSAGSTVIQTWEGQPYGGIRFNRLRGKPGCTPFVYKIRGSKIDLFYCKETDGGSFDVQIDGATVATLDCNGAQTADIVASFDGLDDKVHTVTLQPPASGYAYVSRIASHRPGRTGIGEIHATLGGSALNQLMNVRLPGPNGVAGIPIAGFSGVDAVFDRDDVDFFIYGGPANDAGNGTGQVNSKTIPAFQRIVELTKAKNQPLLVLLEMRGHYRNGPNSDQQAAWDLCAQTFYKAARENPHVFIVDWNAETLIPDEALYKQFYYPNADDNGGTGNYIHPTPEGHRVGSAMICAAAGLPVPDYFLVSDLQDEAQANGFWDPLPARVTYTEYGTGQVTDAPFAWAGVPTGAGQTDVEPAPVVYRDDIENLLRFASDIAASPLKDKDGRYIEFLTTTNYYFVGNSSNIETDRYTITIVTKGDFGLRCDSSPIYAMDGSLVAAEGFYVLFSAPTDRLSYLSFQVDGQVSYMPITGRIYEGTAVTRSGGQPVVCPIALTKNQKWDAFPDARLVTSPLFNPRYLRQVYKDGLGVRKELVGRCFHWDQATQKALPKGLYRCLDRPTAKFAQAAVNGTLTYGTSPFTGGNDYTTTANPAYWGFSAQDLTGLTQFTAALQIVGSGAFGVEVRLFNPSSNAERFLQPDGTWSATRGRAIPNGAGGSADFRTHMMAVSFDPTPVIDSGNALYIGRTDPAIQIRPYSGGSPTYGFTDATLALGPHAMI